MQATTPTKAWLDLVKTKPELVQSCLQSLRDQRNHLFFPFRNRTRKPRSQCISVIRNPPALAASVHHLPRLCFIVSFSACVIVWGAVTDDCCPIWAMRARIFEFNSSATHCLVFFCLLICST